MSATIDRRVLPARRTNSVSAVYEAFSALAQELRIYLTRSGKVFRNPSQERDADGVPETAGDVTGRKICVGSALSSVGR
jgi:hypothetical protein